MFRANYNYSASKRRRDKTYTADRRRHRQSSNYGIDNYASPKLIPSANEFAGVSFSPLDSARFGAPARIIAGTKKERITNVDTNN